MNQVLSEIENVHNVRDLKKLIPQNLLIKSIPNEILQAVIEKDITIEGFKEIMRLNDEKLNNKLIEVIGRKRKYEKNILSNAKFAVRRSLVMKSKMRGLKNLLDKGLMLSTIWDIGKRNNYAGDPTFYGNAPTQVVEQCILRLTRKNDIVLDPMAGSGTTIDVCNALQRKCIAYDLNPKNSDIIKNDSKKLSLRDNSVDMVFLHPPYWNMVKYSDNKDDLSTQPLHEFLNSMEEIMSESARVVKKGKFISILAGDLVENGKFVPLGRKISNIAEKIGLEDCGYAIKLTSNSVSQIRRGKAIYAELAYTKNLKINHDVVMFWKKV